VAQARILAFEKTTAYSSYEEIAKETIPEPLG